MMKRMIDKRFDKLLNQCSDISDICKPLFSNTQITSFNYVKQKLTGSRQSLCTRDDWLEHFIAKEYYQSSPIHDPKFNSEHYALWHCFEDNPVIQDAHENYNISHGISLINRQDDHLELAHFATTRDNLDIDNWYINNIDLLRKFTLYFRQQAADLISDATPIVSTRKIRLSNPQREVDDDTSWLKQMIELTHWEMGKQFRHQRLSKREIQCLLGILQGKTSKSIAKEVNLSHRTVESYTLKLKKKFDAHSKSELVRTVLKTNFLDDCS